MTEPRWSVRLRRDCIKLQDGCWLWMGSTTWSGYGQVSVLGKTTSTHRLAYELHKGPVPAGLVLTHSCGARSCMNPDHLEPVTVSERVPRTHCKRGHELTEDNVRTYAPGGRFRKRVCLLCDFARR